MATPQVIVTIAPTSNFHGKAANPALPEQPDEIAQSRRSASRSSRRS